MQTLIISMALQQVYTTKQTQKNTYLEKGRCFLIYHNYNRYDRYHKYVKYNTYD